MNQVGTAPCGCPLYDTGAGIAKVHGKECEFRPKPKRVAKK